MAVYSLTDHEYRRALSLDDNVTPWITCNLTNSRVELDGTYTIIDIPDEDIPAGLFQVRVKAIGGRHASAILSNDVPFTGSVFNFGNGLFPDGVNDYFTIPKLNGTLLPNSICLEFWSKGISNDGYTYLNQIWDATQNTGFAIRDFSEGSFTTSNPATGYFNEQKIAQTSGINYYCINDSRLSTVSSISSWRNPGGANEVTATSTSHVINTTGSDGNFGEPITINNFIFLANNALESNQFSITSLDELRIYGRNLTKSEAQLNYNSGNGSNPNNTANLIAWYKFEQFEMLDFSIAQDGSDIALGIKDFSGNNNHAKQFNMDTDPLSPNYVLKPFI